MLIVLRPFTFISCLFIPMYENSRVAVLDALIEYLPSISVVVPVVVPLTTTLTPGNGSPVTSVTTPLTMFWA